MSFMDELKKLTQPYDEGGDDFIDEAEALEEPAARPAAEKPRTNPFSNFTAESAAARPAARPRDGRVVNINSGGAGQLQVMLVKPERFETAAEIADHLRNKRPVLVNMEKTPKEITRRLVDFLSGVTYAIDGNIRKVATNTYMLTPPNVDLVGDQLEGLEAGNIYF